MKNLACLFWFVVLTTAVTFSSVRAQIVPDGGSVLYSNATNTFANITIGTNGSFTLFTLGNDALFTNSGNGVIGLNATAKSNEVRLISPTARWLLGTHLFVGSNGSCNRLVVSNGALMRSANGYLGTYLPASNNVALITGVGSTWSNNNVFYLGFNGAGNQLIVSNGGVLRAAGSMAGVNGTSSNNLAIVTGAGSLWSNAGVLQFGYTGSGCQLVISNAGLVRSSLGLFGGGVSASNTAVTVTGSGSLWANTTDFYVGQSSVGNQLFVSNGGAVWNGNGYVGANFTGSNNLAMITGAGSVWSNSLDLNVGAYSGFNRAIASNGGAIFVAGNGIIGPTTNGNGNAVSVSGNNSRWLIGTNLYIGSNGALSQLTIANGGRVENQFGTLGSTASSSNNTVVVTGVGSVWSNTYTLYLGDSGRDNQLWITNGGVVQDRLTYAGYNSSSSSNVAVVAGPGSIWTNTGELYFGWSGAGNQLVVSNGGSTQDLLSYVGFNASSSNNLARVTGSGSTWRNMYELYVGGNSAGNQLEVSAGGLVLNSISYVGAGASASNNLAVVTGAGSVWSNTGDLFIGRNGAGNQLVVSNGGAVWNNTGEIGYGSRSNLAIVTGAGSVWNNAATLLVGRSGSFNQLVVSNGGVVLNENNYAHFSISSSTSNNTAVVTGLNSKWIPFGMILGESGPGNRVVVTNGGLVQSVYTYLGFDSSGRSSNNTVLVTGAGSVWSNAGQFFVGYSGAANQLIISNSGVLSGNGDILLGVLPASTNNRVEINGGWLVASNAFGTARLDVRRGTNVLTAGLVDVGQLLVTNTLGYFEFNSGTLVTSSTTNTNGRVFTVGNGTNAANFRLRGGTHTFANGLAIANYGSLTGNGTVLGTVNVLPGGALAPGPAVGKLMLNHSPVLQGGTLMEVSRNGAVLSHDEVQVTAALTYGGALVVTNIGTTPLVAGDRFKLFISTAYQGSFSSISLPPLGLNLSWTNKLAVDGSLEVVSGPVPQFTGISKSGTNVILTGTGGIANTSYVVLTATNAAQPLNQWTSIATNQFGAGGTFILTNGINPGTPQRFFMLRWP